MLKICLFGPVTSSRRMGGVSTFVESLAVGFSLLKYQVVILTNYAEKTNLQENVSVVSFGNCNPMIFFMKSFFYLKKNPQDLIIGSTWFDLITILPAISGIKFHYLHGFGVPLEGYLKAFAITINDKLHKRNGFLISNSYFTKMVNEVFYCNKVDKVIPIGVTTDFEGIMPNVHRDIDILFVGRVEYNKGAFLLAKAIKYYNEIYNKYLSFTLVGDGRDLDKIRKFAEKFNLKATFIGRVQQKDTMQYYRRSKVFVSLDPREPYGQTFIEAKICGCKIVCPTSGGQVEYLKDDLESVRFVQSTDVQSIAKAIHVLLNGKDGYFKINNHLLYEQYSYKTVAQNIIDYYQLIKLNSK